MPDKIINYRPVITTVVAALFLMVISLYNGYPLFGGDTHSYVSIGFNNYVPIDRTPFYGKFIRLTSLWESLWYTVFAQSLILSCLLTRYIELLYTKKAGTRFILLCVICIVSFTCVSWIASCLMSDIFTPILLLGILLYLFDKKASKLRKALYIFVIFIAISQHNSHFVIASIFSVCLFLFALIRKNWMWVRKSATLFVTALAFWLSMCSINYSYGNGFVFSGGVHMFIMSKFAESGILNVYLNDSCGKKNLKLCACKNDLGTYQWDFMWPAPGTPLQQLDGWGKGKQEYQMIIHDIFTTPKYLKMFAEKSITSTLKQLSNIQEFDKPVLLPATDFGRGFVKDYFSDEEKEFSRSRQNTDDINPFACNIYYYLFFVLSSVWILMFYPVSSNKEVFRIYCCLVVFLIINAFVTSAFSTVHFRFQSKVFWVLPATNAILILKYLQRKYFDKIQMVVRESND